MPLSSRVLKSKWINQTEPQQLPLLELVKTKKENEVTQQAEVAVDAALQAKRILAEAQNKVKLTQAECEKMLQEAEKKEKSLLTAVAAEAEALKVQAQKDGFESGYAEGMAVGEQESQRLQSAAEETLAAARKLRQQMLADLEPQVVDLAVTIAQKFVTDQLLAKPELLQKMIKQALQQLQEAGEIVIRLHPADLPQGREALPDWQIEVGEYCTLSLLADPMLARGDCRVESNSKVVSCRLDERFAALRQVLTEVKTNASV